MRGLMPGTITGAVIEINAASAVLDPHVDGIAPRANADPAPALKQSTSTEAVSAGADG